MPSSLQFPGVQFVGLGWGAVKGAFHRLQLRETNLAGLFGLYAEILLSHLDPFGSLDDSGQIIATSHDRFPPHGRVVGEPCLKWPSGKSRLVKYYSIWPDWTIQLWVSPSQPTIMGWYLKVWAFEREFNEILRGKSLGDPGPRVSTGFVGAAVVCHNSRRFETRMISQNIFRIRLKNGMVK